MDAQSYKQIYDQLLKTPGNAVGDAATDREKVIATINKFLSEYPKTLPPVDQSWVNIPVRDLAKRTIETLIDIINDISALVSQRSEYSWTEYRRQFIDIFFREDRKLYVGFLLVFLSFVLYFIDSSA